MYERCGKDGGYKNTGRFAAIEACTYGAAHSGKPPAYR